MNPVLLYRIAAVLLFLFAVGHTLGFLRFKPQSAEGMSVRAAMDAVTFSTKEGTIRMVILPRLWPIRDRLFAVCGLPGLAPGSVAADAYAANVGLAWAFAGVQLVCFGLSVRYFFLPPALFSGLIVFCLAWAAWLVGTAVT
jgi:hypothetical protein